MGVAPFRAQITNEGCALSSASVTPGGGTPFLHTRDLRDRAHGAEGSRTPYLLNAIQALSQLSYSPNTTRIFKKLYETGLTGIEPATSAVTVRHSNQAELQPQTFEPTNIV